MSNVSVVVASLAISYLGRVHVGIASYVTGEGESIHLIMYQKTYIDAMQVKS